MSARYWARREISGEYRWTIACSEEAHSSIVSAADVMDVDVLKIPTDVDGVLQGTSAKDLIVEFERNNPQKKVFALVGTAGTTNLGIIDDLQGLAKCAADLDIWFHVDGAYGLAALASPSTRSLFKGVEEADSLVVDPHKWLFAPFDACALIYRDARIGKAAHTQRAPYLDPLEDDGLLNPSDYAIQLTRRPRGLPFWFSLAANGSLEYQRAIEHSLNLAKETAEIIKARADLELICEPTLSIVAFKKKGWERADYVRWSDKLLADQIGFVTPSAHNGESILRFAIVNPWTRRADIEMILNTL